MSDLFISYARATEAEAIRIADALKALGYGVWRDDELPAHRSYADVLAERLRDAKAVVVLWSREAVASEWVRSEANRAREDRKIVQLRLDDASLPMPFDQIQCADLAGWRGDTDHPGWRKVVASIAALTGVAEESSASPRARLLASGPALPDKSSVAVLPFAEPNGAMADDYFADGMVEEIATALAKFPALFVVGSGSSLSYRERERDFERIGQELGVRYLVEGSIRRSGPRLRISISLIEAASGEQLWADRFEGTVEDVFALQDEVANAVAARIEPAVQAADLRRGAARPTEDLGAYDLFLRALSHYHKADRAGATAAEALLAQAVERDRAYAIAWAYLGYIRARLSFMGWTTNPQEVRRQAGEAMRNALLTGGDDPVVLVMAAWVTVVQGGDKRTAKAMADRALTLNAGSAVCWNMAGFASAGVGEYQQALERSLHALSLDPRSPSRPETVFTIGAIHNDLGRYEDAVPWLEEALILRPDYPSPMFHLVVALAHSGRVDEAKAMLARFQSTASLAAWISNFEILRGSLSEPYFAGLRLAGADV